MALIIRNPWTKPSVVATGLEAQRKDLWAIDFTQAVAGLSSYGGWGRTLPAANQIVYYAMTVTLPDTSVSPKSFPGLSAPIMYPDVDDALGQIRIRFIVDANSTGSSAVGVMHGLLEAWKTMTRAGRDGFSGEYVPILTSALSYRFTYRFPVTITLYQGNTDSTNFDSTSTTAGLTAGASYFINNMWCAGYQIGELSYGEGNQVHYIDGVFYAESILSAQAGQGLSNTTLLNNSSNSNNGLDTYSTATVYTPTPTSSGNTMVLTPSVPTGIGVSLESPYTDSTPYSSPVQTETPSSDPTTTADTDNNLMDNPGGVAAGEND